MEAATCAWFDLQLFLDE